LPCRLIRENVDFTGLLKYIQLFSAEVVQGILMTSLSFHPSIRICTRGLYLEVF
jgi:hypothetical protein